MTIVTSSFSKSSFSNVFRPHENAKRAFSNCFGLDVVDGVDGRPNRKH